LFLAAVYIWAWLTLTIIYPPFLLPYFLVLFPYTIDVDKITPNQIVGIDSSFFDKENIIGDRKHQFIMTDKAVNAVSLISLTFNLMLNSLNRDLYNLDNKVVEHA